MKRQIGKIKNEKWFDAKMSYVTHYYISLLPFSLIRCLHQYLLQPAYFFLQNFGSCI